MRGDGPVTGVEVLPGYVVPARWDVRSLGSIAKPISIKNQPDNPLLTVARERGVFRRSMTGDDGNHNVIPDDLSVYKLAPQGALVINKMKAWQGSMGIAPCDGVVSPAYYVYDLKAGTPDYLAYLLRSRPYVAEFAAASDGVRIGQWDLSIPRMKAIQVCLPPPEEQAAIVRYLDHATARLDRAVAAKRRVVALLEEQKQAVIHRAVTRGLDETAPMKDSGVPWLGEVPAGWNVRRLKKVFRLIDRRSPTGHETLLSLRLKQGIVPFHEHFSRPPQAKSLVDFKLVRSGEFVINRMQAGNGAIFASRVSGIISPDYSVLQPISAIDEDFFDLLLRSWIYRRQFRRLSKGLGTGTSGFLRLYDDEFLSCSAAIPPLEEQTAIFRSYKQETAQLDKAVADEERLIALLQEYRTALVAEVVTGQRDVCALAAALPPLTDEASLADQVDDDALSDALLEEADAMAEAAA